MTLALVLHFVQQYGYFIITPAAFLLGPVVGLVCGFLLKTGTLSLIPTCIALAVGELGGDAFWYWLGWQHGEKVVNGPGKYLGITKEGVEQAKKLFHHHHDRIVFISKITGGFGFSTAIFFTAGLSGIPFARYIWINATGQAVWMAGLLGIGYFFGAWITSVNNVFDTLTAIGTFVILLLCFWGFARYVGRRMNSDL